MFSGFSIVESEALDKGLANDGIFRHRIRWDKGSVGHPWWGRFNELIEKRTKSKKEVQVAKALCQAGFNPESVLPNILAIEEKVGQVASIFMEYIPGVGSVPPLSRQATRCIADSLASLDKQVVPLLKDTPKTASTNRIRRILQKKEIQDISPKDIAKLNDGRVIEQILSISQVVVCHNDLLWSNMAAGDDTNRNRFVDFASLGWNWCGSDLHHFLRVSVESDENYRFYKRLAKAMADRFGLPSSVVRAVAGMMAIRKFDARMAKYSNLSGPRVRVEREAAKLAVKEIVRQGGRISQASEEAAGSTGE